MSLLISPMGGRNQRDTDANHRRDRNPYKEIPDALSARGFRDGQNVAFRHLLDQVAEVGSWRAYDQRSAIRPPATMGGS
jgi:hypothetical protein